MRKHIIEKVSKLRKRDGRRQTGCTIVEGYPEVKRAYMSKVPFEDLFICPELIDIKQDEFKGIAYTVVNRDEFAAMAFGKRLKGILAICKPDVQPLADIKLPENPLIMVLEGVEKPGNFGSVIRTADGAGFHLVVACDANTDIYNHHVVRSSTGTLFTVPTATATKEELLEFCRSRNICVAVATSKADKPHFDHDMSAATAFIVGNEHHGVTEFWMDHADVKLKIPMSGNAVCLNVAHSASILMYEAVRQRSK